MLVHDPHGSVFGFVGITLLVLPHHPPVVALEDLLRLGNASRSFGDVLHGKHVHSPMFELKTNDRHWVISILDILVTICNKNPVRQGQRVWTLQRLDPAPRKGIGPLPWHTFEASLAEFPALPLFTDAILADTAHLSHEEFGAYMRILILMWRTPECRISCGRCMAYAKIDV
jgi:hypothetical protein